MTTPRYASTADEPVAAMKAVVEPWAAFWLVRTHPEAVRDLQAKGERLVIAGQLVEGRQLLDSAASLRRSAAEHGATLKPDQSPAVAAARVGPRITSAQAAERLEVSVERAREMARDGVIDGEGGGHGRPWRVLESDVEAERRRRGLSA